MTKEELKKYISSIPEVAQDLALRLENISIAMREKDITLKDGADGADWYDISKMTSQVGEIQGFFLDVIRNNK